MSYPFFFEAEELQGLARRRQEEFRQAKPFPHLVVDNFLPEAFLEEVLEEFKAPGQIDWIRYKEKGQLKLQSNSEGQLGPNTRYLVYQLNSSTFLMFLRTLTGIEGLLPDPHLFGGGMHQIVRGGFLKIHADYSKHPKLNLDRRLNAIVYLNKGWKEEYGGQLELWSRDMSRCEKRVLPVFNRLVVFATADNSFHGHPDPLSCPEGWTRKSLALYYYSNGRPAGESAGGRATLWQSRPGEVLKEFPREQPLRNWRDAAKKFIPPIILDLRRAVIGKLGH
ncbi:MAG: 2OG-Fe(II) oxygenase [Elusimicrobia bacterium]|nr:2OG-Fe(II) oxygenase [Elusimicrobiota bacterium]